MARLAAQGIGAFRFHAVFVGVAVAVSLSTTAGLAGSDARPPAASPVSIGEVSGATPAGEFSMPLRSAVREVLDATDLGRSRERFVLSASLVTLDAKKDGRRVSATAVVSMALRREKEQTLHAMLRGSATAEASDVTLESAREDALHAAVESALRRLPEAVLPPKK